MRALVKGSGRRNGPTQATTHRSTVEIVIEFYQDFHAILMRPGVLADGRGTV
jgi:hypothetical protein